MKKIIVLLVAVVVGLGIYFVVSNGTPKTPPAPPQSTAQPTTQLPAAAIPTSAVSNTPVAPVASSVTVEIKNFSFNPGTVNIKTGTKVTWVNNDTVPHTVTSDSGTLLNSPTLAPGQSFSFTFTNTGSVTYHCNIHTTMKGVIVVGN